MAAGGVGVAGRQRTGVGPLLQCWRAVDATHDHLRVPFGGDAGSVTLRGRCLPRSTAETSARSALEAAHRCWVLAPATMTTSDRTPLCSIVGLVQIQWRILFRPAQAPANHSFDSIIKPVLESHRIPTTNPAACPCRRPSLSRMPLALSGILCQGIKSLMLPGSSLRKSRRNRSPAHQVRREAINLQLRRGRAPCQRTQRGWVKAGYHGGG